MESGEYPTVNQHHRRCAANSPDKSPNSKFSSSNSGAKEADAISSDECDVRGEEKWCDVAGPFRRLNALLQAGYDDPKLLLVRLFGMNASHLPNEPNCLWGLLLNLLSEPIPRRRLRGFSKIEHVVQLLSTSKRILVLTGAGVSVSCGIPDFRSRDGIYARLAKEYPELKSSQAMFDMDYFRTNPSIFFKFAKEIFPGQYSPSPAHYFIATLERLDKLLRNYTQNIDTLEQAAGVTRVIQCHGSFATASCTTCHYRVPGSAIRAEVMSQSVPKCPMCHSGDCETDKNIRLNYLDQDVSGACGERLLVNRANGVLKPDIVFFGENLPEQFHDSIAADRTSTDLVLVMGSSLKVRPVALIPNSIPCNVPQILINREPLANHLFDIELYGDCDVIVRHLCALLGWSPPNKLGIEKPSSNVLPSLTDTSISTSACLYSEVPLIDVARIAESENVPSTRAQEPLIETFSTTPHAKTRPYSHFKHKGQLSNASMTGTPSSGFTHFSSYSSDAAYIANRSSDRTDLVSPVIQTSGHVADYASAKGERAALESGDHSEIEEDGPHTAWSVADFLPTNTYTQIPPNRYVFPGAELTLFVDPGLSLVEFVTNQSRLLNNDDEDDKDDEDTSESSFDSNSETVSGCDFCADSASPILPRDKQSCPSNNVSHLETSSSRPKELSVELDGSRVPGGKVDSLHIAACEEINLAEESSQHPQYHCRHRHHHRQNHIHSSYHGHSHIHNNQNNGTGLPSQQGEDLPLENSVARVRAERKIQARTSIPSFHKDHALRRLLRRCTADPMLVAYLEQKQRARAAQAVYMAMAARRRHARQIRLLQATRVTRSAHKKDIISADSKVDSGSIEGEDDAMGNSKSESSVRSSSSSPSSSLASDSAEETNDEVDEELDQIPTAEFSRDSSGDEESEEPASKAGQPDGNTEPLKLLCSSSEGVRLETARPENNLSVKRSRID